VIIADGDGNRRIVADANGNVGIGSENLTHAHKLTVSGTIGLEGNPAIHPDYVFESYFEGSSAFNKAYRLPSLSEVETFVKENKHLPGVQSRAEVEKAGAWNVSENVRTNLEKVEELYLHTIAQEKEIEALKAENAHYEKTMKSILERLELLEDKK